MSHLDIDQYADRSSLVGFDPRVKLVCSVSLVVVLALLTALVPLTLVLLFVLVMVAMSRIPLRHVVGNYVLALVFIVFASLTMLLTSGPNAALVMFIRISASVLVLLVLVTTTPFFKMLEALRSLRMPRVLSTLMMFTYRFIFVLLEEMERMRMARRARGFKGGRSLLDRRALGTISATIGMVFVRSNQRATNIYDALLTRGYSGQVRTMGKLKARPRDAALAMAFVSVGSLAVLIQTEVIRWTPCF